MRGNWGAWILAGSLLGLINAPPASGLDEKPPRIAVLQLFDAIQPITAEYLKEGLRRAEEESCSLVILELDTPGGLVRSTQDIVGAITSSKVPVVVFVEGAHAAS